jgi:hypothetical protein
MDKKIQSEMQTRINHPGQEGGLTLNLKIVSLMLELNREFGLQYTADVYEHFQQILKKEDELKIPSDQLNLILEMTRKKL